ncbi:hypothetical protein GCM10020256_57180 [Streptomyces thermocoprophilus]
MDEQRVAEEYQSVDEEGEPHRGAGVAGALEESVHELLDEEDGRAGQGDREVGDGERQGTAVLAAEDETGERLPQQESRRRRPPG